MRSTAIEREVRGQALAGRLVRSRTAAAIEQQIKRAGITRTPCAMARLALLSSTVMLIERRLKERSDLAWEASAELSPLARAFEHILRSRSYPKRSLASRAALGR